LAQSPSAARPQPQIGITVTGTTAITITAVDTTLADGDGHFKAAAVNPITLVRGTFMEGRISSGDIDNICGGRFGGLFIL
jgi:hypothetical protein